MEIKSSLLNSKEMSLVKDSLIKISEKDHKEDFRVNMLEYINDSADNNDDEFFFDMLEFVRFLNPDSDAVAYTTPEHLIYMNAPNGGGVGERVRVWDFIYCHECLHQLWDTFGVANKIKEEGIKYDHYILNVASDCVINDYLSYYRKKEMFEQGISPQYLKTEYGIEYNRKKDTQFTLYLKLLEKAEELKKDEQIQNAMDNEGQEGQEGQEGSSSSSSGSSSSSSSKSSSSSGSNDNQKESPEDSAKRAQAAADKAKEAAKEAAKNEDEDADKKAAAANKAQEEADKAKEAADKAKEAAKNGDNKEAEKQASAAKEAADKAEQAAKEAGADGTEENGDNKNKSDKKSDNGSKKWGTGDGSGENIESDVNLDEIRRSAEEVINKYKEKLSGDLGAFINQCKMSKQLNNDGLMTGAKKGVSMWNQKLQQYTNAYIKNKIFKKQREFKRTYQRVKRGSGFVEYGQPLQRGKKLKEDKLILNIAFYVDRSGSMSGCIDDVFKASYIIAESMKKQFGKEKVIGGTEFKMFAFDDAMVEVNWGKSLNARGGTMSFDSILKYINEETNDYMINIIITDAGFDVDEQKIEKFLAGINGCIMFVTNDPNSNVKDIANKQQNKTKLFFIAADQDFTIK